MTDPPAARPMPRPDEATRPPRRRIDAAGLVGLVLALLLGLPVATLVFRAVVDGSFGQALLLRVVLDALVLSLATTTVSLAVGVAIGLPIAWLLARRRFTGKAIVETIVDLPIVLPPSVAGLALLLLLGRRGVLGEPLDLLGLSIPFTTAAVVVAQTFVAAPLFIRSARTGIAAVEAEIEDAARVDGASELDLARRIILPLAGPALAAGLVMAWSRALGEFGATILFAGNISGRTQTLPLVVYAEFQAGDVDGAIAASAVLVVAAFGVLVAVRALRWGRALDLRGLA